MKIAVIGNRYNPFNAEKVRGGLEKVELNQLILLSKLDWEVYFITNKDSDECVLPNIKTIKMNVPSKYSDEGEKIGRNLSKIRKQELIPTITKLKPDVILTNDDNNASLNNLIANEIDIPSIVINHSALSIAGGISVFSTIKSMYHLSEKGHTTVFVSEGVRKEWFDLMKKSAKWLDGIPLDDVTKTINEILYCPVMWKKDNFNDVVTNDYCMIARPIPEKKILLGLELCPNLQLFTTEPKNETEIEYLKKIREKTSNIHLNLPHDEIMQKLKTMKGLIQTSDEAGPIVPFEANSNGAPVILYHKRDDHPATEICVDGGLYKFNDKQLCKDFLSSWKGLDYNERIVLQEKIYEKYSPESSTKRLLDLINKAVTKFNNRKKEDNLESFFG